VPYTVRIRGRGRVEVAAYGLADAEHRVTKELGLLWPEATVEVLEVRRPEGEPRIVEELTVSYRVTAEASVEAPSREEAPGEAFRLVRGLLRGSRFQRMELEEGK
jgi:hypothetical protein